MTTVGTARWWFIAALAFVVSMANSLQARVNGAASAYLDNPVVAAMMSVGGGFVVSTVLLLLLGLSIVAVGVVLGGVRRSDRR